MKIQALARLQSTQNVLATDSTELTEAFEELQKIFGNRYTPDNDRGYQGFSWETSSYTAALYLYSSELGFDFSGGNLEIQVNGKTKDALFKALRKEVQNALQRKLVIEDVPSTLQKIKKLSNIH